MNFELGKRYIVNVTEKGIVPEMEFDRNKWFHKDHDDLDFLTDEEKALVVNNTLDKIRAEIEAEYTRFRNMSNRWCERANGLGTALEIIDKYKTES